MERTFWNLYARWYESLQVLIPYRELVQQVVAMLGNGKPLTSIVDVGCGTGNLFPHLIAAYPTATIVGVDGSTAMLAAAEQKIASHGTVMQIDLNRPFPIVSGTFDAALCINVLYAVASPDETLHEIRRILRPGSPLILVNPWVPTQSRIWLEHVRRLRERRDALEVWKSVRALPAFIAILLVNTVIARKARDRTYWFLSAPDVKRRLEGVGFTIDDFREDAYAGICCCVRARS